MFDPRYRDIPFAPLSTALSGFLVARFALPRAGGSRALPETIAAAAFMLSGLYILFNETFANWQAVWFCAALVLLALTLERARDVPSSG